MKKLIISLMPLMFFIGCEDDDGTAMKIPLWERGTLFN